MTGVFFEKIADANPKRVSEKHLGDLLGGTGSFHRQTGAKKERDKRPNQQYDDSHHDVLWNRQIGIVWCDVQRLKQDLGQGAQEVIDQLCYAEYVFFHSLVHGMQDFPHTGRERRGC